MLLGPSAKSNKSKTAPGVALQDRLLRAQRRGWASTTRGADCKYKIEHIKPGEERTGVDTLSGNTLPDT